MDWINSVDWGSDFISGLVGAIVGGLIAGVFSIWAVAKTGKIQRKLNAESAESAANALLQSIHDELEAVFEGYQRNMGEHIEALPEDEPVQLIYPIGNNYFTIYDGNAVGIGSIKDDKLRSAIIKTYTLAKGLIDSYRMNNQMYAYYIQLDVLAKETEKEVHQGNAHANYQGLVEYAEKLKGLHAEVKDSYLKLMNQFATHRVKNAKTIG